MGPLVAIKTNGKRCQQDEVYAAEAQTRDVLGRTWLGTHQDVCDFVNNRVTRSPWYLELVAPKISHLRVERSGEPFSYAYAPKEGEGVIAISRLQRTVEVVLHEIAHIATDAVNGSLSHDPWYTRTHLEIVWYVRGSREYLDLANAYALHGVQVSQQGICWQRKGLIAL